MKNTKWKILILFVVLAVPVFVVLGAWHYVNSLNLKSSMEFVTMEALITETDVGSSGLDGRLYVTCNGIVDGIICFDHSTRIYNKNGKKISGNDLKAGDRLEVRLDGMVIYEPVKTYQSCYLIKVLPEDPTILQEVCVFGSGDNRHELIGKISGEEARVIIDIVASGNWIVRNETYKEYLKLKVAGNILYYDLEEGVFYNRKKMEMMVSDSEEQEKVERILSNYIDQL